MTRSSGVLLHPTSLPPAAGDDAVEGGNGDFGEAAYRFVAATYDWSAIVPKLEQIYKKLRDQSSALTTDY